MKTMIHAVAIALLLGTAGGAFAEEAMSTPMQDNAMGGAMADTMMTPNQMLASCIEHAGMLADMAAQDAGKKTCHDAFALAMGEDAMMSTPMATDGMAADPAAMAPAQ